MTMDGGTVIFPNINNHHNIIHVEFMADRVVLGQVSLQAHWSSPANIIPPIIHTHLPSRAGKIGLFGAALTQDTILPNFVTNKTLSVSNRCCY
jgi:hypothetical protein